MTTYEDAIEAMVAASLHKDRETAAEMLDALILPRSVPCPTCEGTGRLPCDEKGCIETRPHGHALCPDCTDGTVPAPSLLWALLVERGDVQQVGDSYSLDRHERVPVFRYRNEDA